jgi:hypothetical protein
VGAHGEARSGSYPAERLARWKNVPEIPDSIVLNRHRDLAGRRHHKWAGRAVLALLGVIPLLGLFNVFGQHSSHAEASGSAATLELHAPTAVRGGLIYEARFTIKARNDLKHAALVLASDWLKGMTLNTLEPSPVDETSENGSLRLDLGEIPAGNRFDLLLLQYQVNPTTVGRRAQRVSLVDGDAVVATIDRTLRIFP